jgi:hypothetical protein
MTTEEKLEYLIEKIRIMNQAVNNGMPSEVLLELLRTQQTIDGWTNELSRPNKYL